MDARVIIVIGLLLIVMGGAGLYFAYEGAAPGGAALAWAAIILGALTLLGGIGRFMSAFMTPQHARESDCGAMEIRLLIQAMGAMAAADGHIADQEIATIAQVHERMLGMRIEAARVREILAEFDQHFDIEGRLAAERQKLSPQMRRLILNSCYLVMMSDFNEDRKETARIHAVGRALGFSEDQVKDMIAAAGV